MAFLGISRLFGQYSKAKGDLMDKYIKFLTELESESNKYYFPVVMGVCTFDEIRKMEFDDVCHVTKIARLKLQKQHYEIMLSYGF